MLPARFAAFVHRHRRLLFAVWLIHALLIHALVLGYMTWDGFGHRAIGVAEMVQHGLPEFDRYHDWSLKGYLPFVEAIQVPFVYLFGVAGFLIGFPLLLFPLCMAAIYALVEELTGDARAATFGALAFLALPMMNNQPFAGYVDFGVVGLLAFFLFALLRAGRPAPGRGALLRLAAATALFTLSRSQGVYMIVVLFPFLAYAMFGERLGWRIRVPRWRDLLMVVAAVAVGALPSIGVQIWKYLVFGSPTAPMQFQVMGIEIGTGVPMSSYFQYAGIEGLDWGSLWKGFRKGWLWDPRWPVGGFYDGRHLGGGVVLWVALALTPTFLRTASRIELWLVAAAILVSLLSRDFAIARCAYTVIIAVVVVIGRGMSELIDRRRWHPLFWLAAGLLLVHLVRPEVDILQVKLGRGLAPRMNVANSPFFLADKLDLEPFPDTGGKFVIIESPTHSFVLPIYGRAMSNEVVATINGGDIGPRCENLAPFVARDPAIRFIDDYDFAKACQRQCVLSLTWGFCRAYQILPGAGPPP